MAPRKPKDLTLRELTDDPGNANKGTARGRELVESSLRTYGAGRGPVIDRKGRIIAGHKTINAAKAVDGMKTQIVKTDGNTLVIVQREDLDLERDSKARELAVVDNRAGEVGLEWSPEMLRAVQEGGGNLANAGFNAAELEAMFGAPTAGTEPGESVVIPKPAEVVWVLMSVPIGEWADVAQQLAPVFSRTEIVVQTTRPHEQVKR